MQRRLHRLEQLPQFERPPSPLDQIKSLALQQLSDEDLEVMIVMAREREAGVGWRPSERRLSAIEAQGTALETEARRMGFRSFSEAERIGGQRR